MIRIQTLDYDGPTIDRRAQCELKMRSLLLVWLVGSVSAWDKAIENDSEGYLRNIHVVFRHGHREPKTSYPNDPYAESWIWKNGPGQLTILGRQQAFKLGVNLRERYSSLIPKDRAWKVVRAESSDVKRTIMTATTVLSGLLPPGPDDVWSDSMSWQPVDVHSLPSSVDNYLAASPRCPSYQNLRKNIVRSPEPQSESLYNFVASKIGRKLNNRIIMLNVYTCLQIQKEAGLKLPRWTDKVFDQIKEDARKTLLQTSETLSMKRLKSGPFIEKLISTSPNYYPIRLYSTHDTVISGLIGSLSLNVTDFPGFTSTLIFEHRVLEEERFIQIWWSPDSNSDLRRISLTGCSEICPMNRVIDITNPIIPLDWEQECNDWLSKEKFANGNDDSQLWFPTLIVLFALLIFVIFFALLGYRSRDYEWMHGNNVVALNA